LREGSKLVAIGFALGIIAAVFLRKAIANEIYGVRPFDPLVLLGVMVVLTAIALVACAVPARRAMRVDPMVALRYE
jgi:ABC-type antimicrobial peptide transport system permease subunit